MGGEKQLNQSGSRIIYIHPGSPSIPPAALYDCAPQAMAAVGEVIISPQPNASDQRSKFPSENNGRGLANLFTRAYPVPKELKNLNQKGLVQGKGLLQAI